MCAHVRAHAECSPVLWSTLNHLPHEQNHTSMEPEEVTSLPGSMHSPHDGHLFSSTLFGAPCPAGGEGLALCGGVLLIPPFLTLPSSMNMYSVCVFLLSPISYTLWTPDVGAEADRLCQAPGVNPEADRLWRRRESNPGPSSNHVSPLCYGHLAALKCFTL